MAKKRKKSKSGEGSLLFPAIILFLVLFAYIVFYLTIFTSFILILFWLYYEYRSWKYSELIVLELSDLELTEEENDSIFNLKKCIIELEEELKKLEYDENILEDKKKSLFDSGESAKVKKRNDGLFDTRSSKGQQLNDLIKEVKSDIKAIKIRISSKTNEIVDSNEKIDGFKLLEVKRIEEYYYYVVKWISINSYKSSFRYTLPFYLLLVALLTISSPSWLLGLSKWLNNHSNLPILNGFEFIYGAMLSSCIISGLILWQANVFISKKLTSKLMPSWARPQYWW